MQLNFKKVDSSNGNTNAGDILFVNNDNGIYIVESDGSKTKYGGSEYNLSNKLSADFIKDGSTNKVITETNITNWNNKQNTLIWDTVPTENSTNPVTSGGLYTVITTNELVTSTALNNLDSRVSTLEENSGSGGITTETDPVFTASAAYGISANDITNWNNKVSNVQSDWHATTGAAVILNKPTIPTQTTDASVAAWGYIKTITDASISALGYTKNTGTLTGVKFNNVDATVNNGIASITANIPTVNDATLTIKKNGTSVGTFTANASTDTSVNITVNELPTVSGSDNGKILQVVNGQWTLVTPVSIYNGSGEPSNILGNNGDIYIQS